MEPEDLWGDLPVTEKMETPVSVLRAQAEILTAKTNGELVGRVVTGRNQHGEIEHDLRIVAPVLGNYSTTVVTVNHDGLLYPAQVTSDVTGSWQEIGSALDGAGLKELIGRALKSSMVHRTIAALLVQVREETDDIPF